MNAVQGDVIRPVGLDTFADITDAPLVLTGGRVDRNGLLFDGDLTADQVVAIWARMTSRDDADQARRAAIAAARDAVTAGATLENTAALLVLLANDRLGVAP